MTDAKKNDLTELETIAGEAFELLGTGRQIKPFSERLSGFDLDHAYQAAALIKNLREKRGEVPWGRKIGFTNRTIWDEYNVHAPIWGYVYDRTVHNLADLSEAFSLTNLTDPRIEPEIVFQLSAAPASGMDETALLACIDWVAHGFELVQSIYPGWKFSAADTVAAYGLHGALLIGSRHPIGAKMESWNRTLPSFEIDLMRDGRVLEHGHSSNVLGGPVSALRHLVDVLSHDHVSPPLAAGEIVTTGTLTRALPVQSGEVWATRLTGVHLDGISVCFC
jgi:2-oxo-3-hexenedioate decarboxylase